MGRGLPQALSLGPALLLTGVQQVQAHTSQGRLLLPDIKDVEQT